MLENNPTVNAVRKQMFLEFCDLLESRSIRYVILSGYQGYPDQIDSDVDFMVSEADFLKLPKLFSEANCIQGAQLVQMLQHEISACYYVLTKQLGVHLAFLHPDAAASYRRRGRLWLRSEFVLASRRKSANGFWIPSPEVEFEYYLVKRIDKELVEEKHLKTLQHLMMEGQMACHEVLARYFKPELVSNVENSIKKLDTAWFASNRSTLRSALADSIPAESIAARVAGKFSNLVRMTRRILCPTGLVIAVLGPDGSGKTTVIEHLEKEIAPAFRRNIRFHLRPHFGRTGGVLAPVTNPHAQKPRGRLASAVKTLMFIADYWLGWLRSVYPAKVRSTLVVFDRYYHDMLIDPVRYRLPLNCLLPKFLAWSVPQPDLWLILDAPPEILVARKGEITLQAAQELTIKYRSLAHSLPNAVLINTGAGLEETLADVVRVVNDHLATRMQRRAKKAA